MRHFFTTLIIIIISIIIFILNTKGVKLPLFSGYLGGFYLLVIIGAIYCTFGPLKGMNEDEWLKPFTIVAIVFGISILAVIVLTTLKAIYKINVPIISDYKGAYIILAVLIVSKTLVSFIHNTFLKTL